MFWGDCVDNTDIFIIALLKVDNPVSWIFILFWFSVTKNKLVSSVPNEFHDSKTLKPDVYNVLFILVLLFNVVTPLTLNDGNN